VRPVTFAAAGLVWCSALSAQQNVEVCVGTSRSATFAQQVQSVGHTSSNPAVAVGRMNHPADGYFSVTGISPGTATITVTGQLVDYQAGVPTQPAHDVPLADYPEFREVFTVTVKSCGSGSATPGSPGSTVPAAPLPMPSLSADETVALCPGQSRSATFSRQAQNIRIDRGSAAVVRVQLDGERVTLSAVAPGQTVVTVRAELPGYHAGIPPAGASSIPLADYTPFEKRFLVKVKTRAECGQGETEPAPGPPPSPPTESGVFDVCVGRDRGIALPKGIGKLRDPQSDDQSIATATVRQSMLNDTDPDPDVQATLLVRGNQAGRATILAQDMVRVNRPVWHDRFPIRVRACDVSGTWGGDVAGTRIAQEGDRLTLTFPDGQVYRGSIDVHGTSIRLSRQRTSPTDPSFAANIPDRIRRQLVPSTLRIEATLTPGMDTIRAVLIGERATWEGGTVTRRTPTRKAFTLVRAPGP
jgi:hypothetical protein